MEAVLAARFGDAIGSHGMGWGELIGDVLGGILVGVVVGALAVLAVAAIGLTGGLAAVAIGAAIAGGVAAGAGTTAGLMKIGQLGREKRDKAKPPSCSKVAGPCSPNVIVYK